MGKRGRGVAAAVALSVSASLLPMNAHAEVPTPPALAEATAATVVASGPLPTGPVSLWGRLARFSWILRLLDDVRIPNVRMLRANLDEFLTEYGHRIEPVRRHACRVLIAGAWAPVREVLPLSRNRQLARDQFRSAIAGQIPSLPNDQRDQLADFLSNQFVRRVFPSQWDRLIKQSQVDLCGT